MRLNNLGEPIIVDADDENKTAFFVQRLARELHGRLPKFVKTFISPLKLEALIQGAINNIAAKV